MWYPGVYLSCLAVVSLVALRKGHAHAKQRGDERAMQYAHITEEFGGDDAMFGGGGGTGIGEIELAII